MPKSAPKTTQLGSLQGSKLEQNLTQKQNPKKQIQNSEKTIQRAPQKKGRAHGARSLGGIKGGTNTNITITILLKTITNSVNSAKLRDTHALRTHCVSSGREFLEAPPHSTDPHFVGFLEPHA